MSEESPITLSVGTHTWFPSDEAKLQSIISIMRTHNISILDTARLYVRINLGTHLLVDLFGRSTNTFG